MEPSLPFFDADIFKAVEEAEVLVIGFHLFPERLLVDARYNAQEGPLIQVMPPLGSWEERLRELRRLRPAFGVPGKHAFFIWPRSLETFQKAGLWERIVQRCTASASPNVLPQCQEALDALQQREHEAMVQAIRGENYQSLWERKA